MFHKESIKYIELFFFFLLKSYPNFIIQCDYYVSNQNKFIYTTSTPKPLPRTLGGNPKGGYWSPIFARQVSISPQPKSLPIEIRTSKGFSGHDQRE